MHIQIVRFQLKDLTDEGYQAMCDQLAPAFAAVPGLLSKVWLASPGTNTYGGVYTWRDQQAMEDYTSSKLFAGMVVHPNFVDVTSTDFGVLEAPTRVTGGAALVAA